MKFKAKTAVETFLLIYCDSAGQIKRKLKTWHICFFYPCVLLTNIYWTRTRQGCYYYWGLSSSWWSLGLSAIIIFTHAYLPISAYLLKDFCFTFYCFHDQLFVRNTTKTVYVLSFWILFYKNRAGGFDSVRRKSFTRYRTPIKTL